MPEVRDSNGKVIQRSRNLAGIHRYVSKHTISKLSIDRLPDGDGYLRIHFTNGATYETDFADFSVLLYHVRHWRNVYGSPLFVNGEWRGEVDYRNIALTWVDPWATRANSEDSCSLES